MVNVISGSQNALHGGGIWDGLILVLEDVLKFSF